MTDLDKLGINFGVHIGLIRVFYLFKIMKGFMIQSKKIPCLQDHIISLARYLEPFPKKLDWPRNWLLTKNPQF